MKENGFEYVDLGLPSGTMWATCNVGANKSEDPGLLFQFGRVDGYKHGDKNHKFRTTSQNKQDTNNEDIPKTSSGKIYHEGDTLDLEDDAAHVNMGGKWRMPTGGCNPETSQHEGDWGELLNNTTNTVTTINGVNGMLFTSQINGNQLFIPFVQGFWDVYNDKYVKFNTKFDWGAVIMQSSKVHNSYDNDAYRFYCDSNGLTIISFSERSRAFTVRGVFKK